MSTKLDNIDRGILRLLQKDARIPFSTIARELKISESTVRFRVKRLVKEGILRKLTAMLDPRKVGFPVTAVLMVKVDPALFGQIADKLSSFDELHHVFQLTGEYDIVTMIHTSSVSRLNDLVKEIKMIPGIRDVLVSMVTNVIKVETAYKI